MTTNLSTLVRGQLEIDTKRGVIYFHISEPKGLPTFNGVTLLRICRLPTPIPVDRFLDITHKVSTSWDKQAKDERCPSAQVWSDQTIHRCEMAAGHEYHCQYDDTPENLAQYMSRSTVPQTKTSEGTDGWRVQVSNLLNIALDKQQTIEKRTKARDNLFYLLEIVFHICE